MSWRANAVLAALILAVVAYIGLVERKQLGTDAYKGRQGRVLAGFDQEKVTNVHISPSTGETIKLTRQPGDEPSWQITAPEQAVADADVVGSYLDVWEYGIALRRLLEVAPSELPDFGLEPPTASVALELLDGTRLEIRLGNKDLVSAGYYLTVLPGSEVMVVDHSVQEAFSRNVEDFRFKEEDLDTLQLDAGP